MKKKPIRIDFAAGGIASGEIANTDSLHDQIVPLSSLYKLEVYKNGVKAYEGEFNSITIKSKWYQFWKWFN